MTSAPPGWYDDGQHPGALRWWNGVAWTDDYHPALGDPPAVAAPRRAVWGWVLAASCVAFVAVAGLSAWGIVNALDQTRGPRETIAAFDRAWETGDCALLRSATTTSYQTGEEWEGDVCAWFVEDPADYDIEIQEIRVSGDHAVATTRERWTDPDGTFDEIYEYRFVRSDGGWRIDAYEPVDGDLTPVD
ncbi:MAG: DUF2510 domain-containing protein [Microbacteriaceae bacterium]|nr:DUF2510 domain-containing protein [Microbacteriaceae bacterium]